MTEHPLAKQALAEYKLIRGFTHAVEDAQQNFRLILQAMSEPGTIVSLICPTPPASLDPATFACCLTLFDSETTLWLSPVYRGATIQHTLGFHTDVVITEQRETAHFSLIDSMSLMTLDGFRRGSAAYPEIGVTLLLQVRLSGGDADVTDHDIITDTMTTLRLTGPGIETDCRVRVAGIAECVLDYLIQRPDPFPLGMDVILIEDERLMCIPRTTTVEIC